MPPVVSLVELETLQSALEAGDLLLVPNQRLATRIRAAWAQQQRAAGRAVLRRPPVYALSHWLQQCWQQLLLDDAPLSRDLTLLGAQQEQLLWQRIISESEAGGSLLRIEPAARQLASAYRYLAEWQQDLQQGALRARFNLDSDYREILAWMDSFEIRCQEEGWLPAAQLPGLVARALDNGELSLPGPAACYGFEEFAPAHRHLFDLLTARQLTASADPGAVQVTTARDEAEELQAAALWARKILQQDEDATVAVVIPDLAQRRAAVERVFREVFEPGFRLPDTPRRPAPFNISAGLPLATEPLVAAALDALALVQQDLPRGQLLALLHSPFLGAAAGDPGSLGALVRRLYELGEPTIRPAALRQAAARIAEQSTESWPLADALQRLADSGRRYRLDSPRAPSAWSDVFEHLLDCIGWPGQRPLDSVEYQQLQQWRRQLGAFGGLDSVTGAIGFAPALGLLRQQLQNTAFQPQTPDSPLQLLGTLEAAGLSFSHLWLCGMSERQWPPPPSPNPMLPPGLQRELALPHASAARELAYCRRLSERFVASADQVVVSHPAQRDEYPVAVSALFATFPRRELSDLLGGATRELLPAANWRREAAGSVRLESWEAGQAPALVAQDPVRGGSQLFVDQAACPFRAMGRHRLALRSLEPERLGLDARERGQLLHQSLELAWRRLQNRQQLLSLANGQLAEIVADVTAQVLREFRPARSRPLGGREAALEQQRLGKILSAWLELERGRGDFEVAALESRQQFEIGGLELRGRLDRIDRLPDGGLLILDYKSGRCTTNDWWSDRPDNPQLPLYAVALAAAGEPVRGVAYGSLRPEGCRLMSAGAEEGLDWPRQADAPDWHAQIEHWRAVIERLAADYRAGLVPVDPKKPPQTCAYCDLAPLCRVHELEQEEDA